ncbi:MAG: hypothetical protein WCJ30_14505 [Deltaproteobacteria bacterium]
MLADEGCGPLRIDVPSPAVAQVMQSHKALASAARRSMDLGPFAVSTMDGTPHKVRVGSKGLEVTSPTGSQTVPHDQIATIKSTHQDDGSSVIVFEVREGPSLACSARTQTLEGLHAAMQTYRLVGVAARDIGRFQRSIEALEREWFAYSVYGPFIAIEEALSKRTKATDPTVDAAVDQEGAEIVAIFSDAIPLLREHLDAVMGTLAAHVEAADRRLFALGKMAWPEPLATSQEGHLRGLSAVAPLVGQLARIERELSRVTYSRQGASGSEKTVARLGAAASLGLGLLTLNPAALISGAAQAGRLMTGGSARRTDEAQRNREVSTAILTAWRYLMDRLVPPSAQRLEVLLGEPRARVASAFRRAGGEKLSPHALTSLARRLAKLEVFRLYPHPGAGSRPRGESIDALKALRGEFEESRFATF